MLFRPILALMLAMTANVPLLAQRGFEPLDPALRNVRGVNFVPTYPSLDGTTAFPYYGVASPTAQWAFFDATTEGDVKQQLLWAHRTGFNTVRVFLSYLCWQYHDANPVPGQENRFVADWDRFVGLCAEQKLRVLPVVFDFVSLTAPYVEPDYVRPDRLSAEPHIGYWHDSPGRQTAHDAYGKDFAALDLGRFVRDCARVLDRHDPEVLLAWDAANEPYVAGGDLGSRSRWFVQQTMAVLKAARPRDRVLVSSGVNDRYPTTLAWAQDANCDVLGIHVYGPNSQDLLQAFVHDATFVTGADHPFGKPVLATEIGHPGAGFSYQDTVRYCRDVPRPDLGPGATGVGFCTWMLMIGHADRTPGSTVDDRHPFKYGTGLFYGHTQNGKVLVRDLAAVRAFVELAVAQGIARKSLWFGNTQELQAIGAIPPTHPFFVDPRRGGQVGLGLAQRWVQNFVLTATRADYCLPGFTFDDYCEIAALLREMTHPNLDLKRTVSTKNGNPFAATTDPSYDLSDEQLAKLQWYAAASLPGSPAFALLIKDLERRNGLPAGKLQPWAPANPNQARDLRILFGDFLWEFAQQLAPIMLPR